MKSNAHIKQRLLDQLKVLSNDIANTQNLLEGVNLRVVNIQKFLGDMNFRAQQLQKEIEDIQAPEVAD